MEYRRLGKTDLYVSAISFGASSLGGVFRNIDENEGIRTVHIALDMGINLIDVSPYYGLTKAETVLGKALATVPRERYFLATKIGRYGNTFEDFDFSAEQAISSIDKSLRRLGVEYLDLIQCHDIEFGSLDQLVNETIPALRKIQKQGKVRFVGITGLPLKVFSYVLDHIEVDTILSYCHYSMNDTSLETLLPYLKEKHVGIINASPLSMGLLSQRGTPVWHPADEEMKNVCAKAAQYCEAQGERIEKLAVQFSVRNPDIATTLSGTANPENIKKNIEWVEEPIKEELLNKVLEILKPIHNKTWPSGRPENN
jgi:aryl-alcohol dehydrogenase-like predicted oxidoreductase